MWKLALVLDSSRHYILKHVRSVAKQLPCSVHESDTINCASWHALMFSSEQRSSHIKSRKMITNVTFAISASHHNKKYLIICYQFSVKAADLPLPPPTSASTQRRNLSTR